MDCFKEVGLQPFVTDQEHWNEELLLQFCATLHIRGYNRDPKTWVMEWMTGNVHHEAKAFDIMSSLVYPLPEISRNLAVNFTVKLWRASFRSLNLT